jgi:hypothetical protein
MKKTKLFAVAGLALAGAVLSACGGGGGGAAPQVSYIIDENNEVYKVDPNLSMQPNNHVADAAMEWLKDIYPDIFTELSKSLEKSLKDAVEKIKGLTGTKESKSAA